MNDLLSTDEAEERLRRTLGRRAERMAAGDGASGVGPPTVPLVPLGGDAGAPPSVGRRLLLAAAVVAAVVGIGVAATVSSQGGDTDDAGDTTAGPESSTAPAQEATTTAPPATLPDCNAPAAPVDPPPGYVPPPEGYVPRHTADPKEKKLASWFAEPEPQGPVELTIDQKSFFPFEAYPGAEPIEGGEGDAWLLTMEGSSGQLMAARLEFDDLVVMVTGLRVDRQVVLDVAASVQRDGDTFTYTAPPGLTPFCVG